MGRRYQSDAPPYCLIGKISWGVAQCIKVPESIAHRYQRYGWSVLIRDTDIPPIHSAAALDLPLLSGSARRMWLNEEDVQRELDDDEDYRPD
jgi:hypothetical protein